MVCLERGTMNAIMRKDGSLYLRLHDDDAYRCLDNGIELFLSPEQVNLIKFEFSKEVNSL